jgi:hypothetical protein
MSWLMQCFTENGTTPQSLSSTMVESGLKDCLLDHFISYFNIGKLSTEQELPHFITQLYND